MPVRRWTAWIALSLLFSSLPLKAQPADQAREKRWAEEVVPSLVVGEAVWLQGKGGARFLGLYTEAGGHRLPAGVCEYAIDAKREVKS